MFLQNLYRYNKALFFIVLLFFTSYIFLNYKWGLTATPVQQYGMFSGKFFIRDPLSIYIVSINGKRIDESGISQTERDIIQSYPAFYEAQAANNEAVFKTISVLFRYAGISATGNVFKFANQISDHQFSRWYTSKLQDIVQEPIATLKVFKQPLTWKNGHLIASGQPLKISFIAAQ